jgi:effector-binding domain-containing protein
MTIVTAEAAPTAVVAETTTWDSFPAVWPRLLDEVYAFVRRCDELASGNGDAEHWKNVMLYKDDQPSVEVGVLAPAPFTPDGRVIASHLPAGKVVVAVHHGEYAALGRTHSAVRHFAAANELALSRIRWEVYGHWREDPRERETEVYYLLR